MKPRRVEVPLFEIASNPTVALGSRRFSMMGLNRICPVCHNNILDIQSHLDESTDDEHAVYDVHET